MSSQHLQIPSINFGDLDPSQPNGSIWEETRIQVFSALETYGCFDAIYNKVGSELTEALFGSVVPEMFALPLERKQMNKSKNYLGYIGNITDVEYESLRIEDADNLFSVEKFAQMLYPEGNQLFINTISSYAQHVRSIEQMVERMIFQSLSIEKYCDSHLESLTYGVRLASYGDLQDKEARVSLRSHKDPNFITIVRQNGIEGLEVLSKEEEWIRVAPSPDSFTVMIGETMTVLTNGRLKAAVHRVSVDQKRNSVMLGSLPKEQYLIEAPKELINENHPLKYSPFDVYKYLEFMYSPEGHHQPAQDYLKAFYGFLEE
ncbi:hypothetical protein LUZ60_001884 [Juncus effusus]|nr:hypothetical protein LUZ60_001884 [Juncus effusus]